MFRYLDRSEPGSVDFGDMEVASCSLELSRDGGGRELDRDGGGRRSGEGFSSGSGATIGGGTTVASDFWLPGLCRGSSVLGGDGAFPLTSSFPPLSSASSVISIRRRRRSELDEEVIDPDAVWSRQADDKELSLRSEAWVRGKTVSFGVNLSRTDWN